MQVEPGAPTIGGMIAGVVEDQGDEVIVRLANDKAEALHSLRREQVRTIGYLPTWGKAADIQTGGVTLKGREALSGTAHRFTGN